MLIFYSIPLAKFFVDVRDHLYLVSVFVFCVSNLSYLWQNPLAVQLHKAQMRELTAQAAKFESNAFVHVRMWVRILVCRCVWCCVRRR